MRKALATCDVIVTSGGVSKKYFHYSVLMFSTLLALSRVSLSDNFFSKPHTMLVYMNFILFTSALTRLYFT